ncbi:MAG: O-antigen ligase family protein [Bacilli bacterium]|nr:O-antigen ligase family protein [Bacilli bacterium]
MNKYDKFLNKLMPIILILFPFIDVLTSLQIRNNIGFISVGTLIRGIFLILIIIYLKKKNVNNKILFVFGLYFILELGYIFLFTKSNIYSEISNIFEIFYLPFLIYFFKKYDNKKIDDKYIFIIYLIYLNLILIPRLFGIGFNISEIYKNKHGYCGLFYSGNEISAILLGLLPIVLNYVFKLKNYIIKIFFYIELLAVIILLGTKTLFFGSIIVVGYYFIKYLKNNFKKMKKIYKLLWIFIPILFITSIIIYLPKTSVYKNIKEQLKYYEIDEMDEYISENMLDRVVFSSRLSFLKKVNNEYINKNNKYGFIYGLSRERILQIKDIEIDIFDIFYSVGIFGSFIYILMMIYALKGVHLRKYYKFSFILFILMSLFSGHILIKPMVSIYIAILFILNKNDVKIEKKKILLVSNMYPSKKYKHYGSFVKNVKCVLEDNGYIVDKSVMYKKDNIIGKIISYLSLYFGTILKGMFNNYDYIYVHFISHSAWPAVFLKKTSKNICLVFNAHGNDVVMDLPSEEKNIKRSKKYIPYADKVVVPSNYYKNVMIKKYNVDENKIFVYPSGGVNTDMFVNIDMSISKKECNLKEEYNYIGYASRIEKNKGWDTFLKAIKLLKDENKIGNKRFLIVGSGSEEKDMNKMMKELDIVDYIETRSLVSPEELVNIYNSLQIFVFPTYRESESLGLVGLEAMSCETFVIASENFGPTDYVRNMKNGLFFKGQDFVDLKNKILEYDKLNNEQRKKILKKARETALKYDVRNTKDEILKVFK